MSVRPIIEVPNPLLKTISTPVGAVTDETRALMDDMVETMYDANGIGLAAIQVGVSQRIVVMDISPDSEAQDDKAERYDLSGLEMKACAISSIRKSHGRRKKPIIIRRAACQCRGFMMTLSVRPNVG
jgi:hypothetical protein